MNERTKELMKQASTTRVTGFGEIDTLDTEKFAELIIKECAELFPLTSRPLSGGAIQSTLKEHFGVTK